MHGNNQLRLGGVFFDLLAQPGDVIINRSSKGEVVIAPDFIQQLQEAVNKHSLTWPQVRDGKHGQSPTELRCNASSQDRRLSVVMLIRG